jgi:Ca2+-binding RTX toxin-like protein
VSDGTDTDLLVGIEKIEFTDGVVQAAPTRSTSTKTTIENGEEEVTTIDGSPYADTISSTTGAETFIGNGGLDKFVFVANSGVDKILDFTIAGTDTTGDGTVDSYEKISLTQDDASNSIGINGTSITSASSVLQRITSSSDGALIDLGSSNSITLIGITASDLTASHFEIL